jgi:hypothetical protein
MWAVLGAVVGVDSDRRDTLVKQPLVFRSMQRDRGRRHASSQRIATPVKPASSRDGRDYGAPMSNSIRSV